MDFYDFVALEAMQLTYFADSTGINAYLLPSNPISDQAIIDAMYNDPFYGLSNYENYAHWQSFGLAGTEDEVLNKKLAWAVEVQFYFGLSRAQVAELALNWNSLFTNTKSSQNASIPSTSTYQNANGFQYWQWASAWASNQYGWGFSIADADFNVIQGFYEISYWKSNFFNLVVNA